MRPPNPRLADNGTSPDFITVYSLDISAATAADEEGNWIRKPTAGNTCLAIVTPSFSSSIDADGTEISVTQFQVMLYCSSDPQVYVDSVVQWNKGKTLRALGDAVIAAAGAWAFMAAEYGPNPGSTSLPYGA